jgi:polycystin 1L2
LTSHAYWSWLENDFVSNIRAQNWYNGDAPRHLSGFINDKSSRLIGWPTMRQVRIQSRPCASQRIEKTCEDDYSVFNEETRSFELSWTNETSARLSSSIHRAFYYRSSNDLNTFVYIGDHQSYSGGGYVYEFRGRLTDLQKNLSELHRSEWIDQRTRAVIIQLTLYNPNVQLLSSVFIVTEFLSTGALYTHIRIEPMNFFGMSTLSMHLPLNIVSNTLSFHFS